METPRQLYAKQCPPTRERVAGDVGKGRNGKCKYGNKKLDTSPSDEIHVVAKISSDTIQTPMNAKGNENEKLKMLG
jgi:hypothetical protein